MKQYEKIELAQQLIDRHTMNSPFVCPRIANLVGDPQQTRYMRMANPVYPSDPRHLVRLVPFSWNKEIKGRDARQEIHKALRLAIQPDIDDARAVLPAQCPCGATEFLQVDHVKPPFVNIADAFMTDNQVATTSNNGVGLKMRDMEQESSWIAFHASLATYQILCRSCNASKGARGV